MKSRTSLVSNSSSSSFIVKFPKDLTLSHFKTEKYIDIIQSHYDDLKRTYSYDTKCISFDYFKGQISAYLQDLIKYHHLDQQSISEQYEHHRWIWNTLEDLLGDFHIEGFEVSLSYCGQIMVIEDDSPNFDMEDVRSLCVTVDDIIEAKLHTFGIKLTNEQEDEIHEKVWEVLESVSTGNYRHHM